MLRLTRALLALRRAEPLLARADWAGFDARARSDDVLALCRRAASEVLLLLVRLRGAGAVEAWTGDAAPATEWRVLLHDRGRGLRRPADADRAGRLGAVAGVTFARPGAVLLKAGRR